MHHFEKGSQEEGSLTGNPGDFFFFSRDLYNIGKLWTKFQLYNFFSPEIILFDPIIGKFCEFNKVDSKNWCL